MIYSSSTILTAVERVDSELVSLAKKLPSSILADVAGRRGSAHGRIQPLSPSMKIAGPAITVEVRPGDNLMFHVALAIAQPGDVIVVDGKGDQTCALCGGIMALQAEKSGIAGFVVDAAVRDKEEIIESGFPVFSVGTNPCGPTKNQPGLVNHPISFAGVTVRPGDLVVGDADGIVVLPKEKVAELIVLGQQKLADEERRMNAIRSGQLHSTWLEPKLKEIGLVATTETV